MYNKEFLNTEFEKCRPQLKSFVLRMTASIPDTEDLVQDTYLKANERFSSFRGDAQLKTWIFAIATNLTRDFLRTKKRWPQNVTDICREAALGNPDFLKHAVHIRNTSPQGHFEIKEHIAFCFTCIGKSLPLEEQICILLKEVYGFKVAEIAEIMLLSEGVVKHHLHDGRKTMINVFDKRCALINKEGVCHQCSELNGIFNPKQSLQEELMKIEMARDAATKSKEHLFDLRTQIVQQIDPFLSPAAELQLGHLQHNKMVMDKYLGES